MAVKADQAYSYVRQYYGVPAYIGVPVDVRGRGRGVLAKPPRDDQYVYVTFDDAKRPRGPFHPTDGITYHPNVSGRSQEGS